MKAVASEMRLSEKTIEDGLRRIRLKLGFPTKHALLAWYAVECFKKTLKLGVALLVLTVTFLSHAAPPPLPPAAKAIVRSQPAVGLQWDDPNAPGSSLGYKVYWGPSSGAYTNNQQVVTNSSVVTLEYGSLYFFAVTCLGSGGSESVPSNEVAYQTPNQPMPPTNLVVVAVNLEGSGNLVLWTNVSVLNITNYPGSKTTFYRSSLQIKAVPSK